MQENQTLAGSGCWIHYMGFKIPTIAVLKALEEKADGA